MKIRFKVTVVSSAAALLCSAATLSHAAGRIDTTFDAGDFSGSSAVIDNAYMALPENTTFVYRSIGKDGCEVNDTTVTNVTPMIDGVETRQVHDVVYEDDDCDGTRGFLSEDTLDWYAEDVDKNVWYFGEDTKSYCDPTQPNVVCSTEGSWTAGMNDAEPGIVMLADPANGDSYRQEYAEEAQDMAKVLRTNARVDLVFENEIDPDSYHHCVVTKEWSPLEHGAIEHKFYCAGSGLLVVNELQGGPIRTELVAVNHP